MAGCILSATHAQYKTLISNTGDIILISYMHLNNLEITHAGMLKCGHYIDRNFILTGKNRTKRRKHFSYSYL